MCDDIVEYISIGSQLGDKYLNILCNLREIKDLGEDYHITRLTIKKTGRFSGNSTIFHGNVESDNESRYIQGRIYDMNNKVLILDGYVTIGNLGLSEEYEMFDFEEEFIPCNDGSFIRITYYTNNRKEIVNISSDDFYNKEKNTSLVRR